MAERVFARKLERVGFENISVGGHRPFGIEDASLFPLFTEEIIGLMRELIPPERQGAVATSVMVTARKPG